MSDSTIAGDEEIGAGSYTGAKIVVAEENGGRSLDENQGSSSIDDEGSVLTNIRQNKAGSPKPMA